MSDNLYKDIYNKGLDIISRREHSKKEVFNKLSSKFKSEEVINSALLKLEENNLINDLRFAEMYTISRKNKGFGPKRVAYELGIKGVHDSIIAQVIDADDGWVEVARNVFNKKFKSGPASDFKASMKQKTFMKNRGFSFKEIESVMKQDML